MIILLTTLALVGCLNQNTYVLREGEAMCRKISECSDEMESTIEAANWDSVWECYDDAADKYEERMENEEAAACQKKYCKFDASKAQYCLDAIAKIKCSDMEDGSYDIDDCYALDIIDCTDDADDYTACIEAASQGGAYNDPNGWN